MRSGPAPKKCPGGRTALEWCGLVGIFRVFESFEAVFKGLRGGSLGRRRRNRVGALLDVNGSWQDDAQLLTCLLFISCQR